MATKLNRKDERQVREFTQKAIRSAMRDVLFSPLTLGEKTDIRVKPKFETACWSYLPPHRIYVGLGIVGKAKESLTSDELADYVKSHVHHELAHAHWTERNMRKVKKELKKIEAPFQLFNLFEDARIEDRYRREADYKFAWLTFEDLAPSLKPESLLFGLIQAEGDEDVVDNFLRTVDIEAARAKRAAELAVAIANCKNPLQLMGLMQAVEANNAAATVSPEEERAQMLELFERVVPYYRRMVEADDTAGIYPILTDWMEEFGKPESAPSMGCGGGVGDKSDLEIGAELAEDADVRDAFDADADEVTTGKDSDEEDAIRGKAKPSEDKAIASKGKVLGWQEHELDLVRVEKLANKLKRFFQAEERRVATSTPQRKVSARHFAVGRPYYRVKQLVGKAKKKIVVEVDCSSSMNGSHIAEGRILIAALSRLAREGYVEGHVLLSAGSPPRWELFQLPMGDQAVARIQAFAGAEGLEATMRSHLPLLREADFVFVYTDAHITDAPIDKPYLHRQGIFTWGLYAGTVGDSLQKLQLYFDKAIMRENAEALVDAMLVQKK
jgi:hypothetical protein